MQRFVGSLGCSVLLVCACTEIDDLPGEQPGTQTEAGIGGSSGGGGRAAIAGRSGTGGAVLGVSAGRGVNNNGGAGANSGGSMSGESQPGGEGIGAVGAPCTQDKPKACLGQVSTRTLVCANGKWTAGPDCAPSERCDTAPGDTQGTCLPMLSLCSGKLPGAILCDAYARRKCGNDLVRFEAFACPEHAHCDDSRGAVSCACDLNFKSDGADVCIPNVVCPAAACVPGGHCVVGPTDYSCMCDVEFQGTGTKDCVAVGRCAMPTVCNADYVCRSKDMTYVCRGQFADWPMPTTSTAGKTAPSYLQTEETVSDAVTGLTWQRNLPQMYAGCSGTCPWEKAKAYCEGLVLEGADDWRLPTMIELVSILDDNAVMPSIDAASFPNTPSDNFWSASPNAGDVSQAWGVGFAAFQILARPKSDSLHVRCVR